MVSGTTWTIRAFGTPRGWVETELRSCFRKSSLSAVRRTGGLRCRITLDGNKETDASGLTTIAKIQRELADRSRLQVAPMVVSKPWKDGPEVQPALIRSARSRYAARGHDEHTAQSLIRMIRDGGALPIAQLEHPATRPQMGAEMYKETRWDEGAIGQALVKTAINFICAGSVRRCEASRFRRREAFRLPDQRGTLPGVYSTIVGSRDRRAD